MPLNALDVALLYRDTPGLVCHLTSMHVADTGGPDQAVCEKSTPVADAVKETVRPSVPETTKEKA